MQVAAVFAAVGLFLVFAGIRSRRAGSAFAGRAQRAPGVVTGLHSRVATRSSTGTTLFPVVRFTLPDGRVVEAESSIGSTPPAAREGDSVTVLYDPDEPTVVLLERQVGTGRVVSGCVTAFGAAFAVLGVLVAVAALVI